MNRYRTWLTAALVLLVISSCADHSAKDAFEQLQARPMPLARVTSAEINPAEPIRALPAVDPTALTTPMVNLGRQLFHDTRLSGDGTLACASCHAVNQGGDDNLPTSTGIRGQIGPINAPTVLNSGFNFRQFWDGRAPTLDEQAKGPVAAEIEMGGDWSTVVATLAKDDALKAKFKIVFGSSEITQELVVHAIARYEESLVTPSPFDRYLSGDVDAISDQAVAGYDKFKRYGCASCHQGINIGGNLYQQFGVVQQVDIESFKTLKSEPVIYPRDKSVTMVKVPSLRNIELTAPYFNGGKIHDLHTAVRVMGISQTGNVVAEEDVDDIVEFLKSLTGDWQQHAALIE